MIPMLLLDEIEIKYVNTVYQRSKQHSPVVSSMCVLPVQVLLHSCMCFGISDWIPMFRQFVFHADILHNSYTGEGEK